MSKKYNNMETLKQLIEGGLKVGALVKRVENKSVFQYMGKNLIRAICFNSGDLIGSVKNVHIKHTNQDGYSYELTTAYDSNINPETLPIQEPFWTGWAIRPESKKPKKIYKISNFEENQGFDTTKGNELIVFTDDYWNYKSDCQPCLPPK